MIEIISPATFEHAEAMRGKVRPADIEEYMALTAEGTVEAAVKTGVSMSVKSWAGVIDGEVVCVCGVAPVPQMPESGAVWLVGTELMDRAPIEFLRHSRRILAEMLGVFPHLWNFADSRHTKALQWLQWLGFDIYEPIPLGPYGFPFHLFEIRRPHV